MAFAMSAVVYFLFKGQVDEMLFGPQVHTCFVYVQHIRLTPIVPALGYGIGAHEAQVVGTLGGEIIECSSSAQNAPPI